jgi:tetratricopeptide (TPR) repeat protein
VRSPTLSASIVAVAVLAAVPLLAQDAPRTGWRELRQNLASVADAKTLRQRELATIEVARTRRDDPDTHLELGFIALRLGEVTGMARHYQDALDEFGMATDLRPHWWIGWYGQAIAEMGVLRTDLGFLAFFKTMTGRDQATSAARLLAKSAEVDSLRAEGLVQIARDALASRDPQTLDIVRDALAQAAMGPAWTLRDVRLVRALVEREFGQFDFAMRLLEPLLQDAPEDTEVRLELAETRFNAGRIDGARDWFRALEEADAELLERFRRDLVLVIPDSTLSAILGASGTQRSALAERFWESQTRVGIAVTPERLRDHYLWLRLARHRYRRQNPNVPAPSLPGMRMGSTEFDARGVVTVLHGPPPQQSALNLPGIRPNESWGYYSRLSADTMLFHFIVPEGQQDFVQVESVLDLFRLGGQARFMTPGTDTTADGRPVIGTYGASLTAQTSQELFVSRIPLSPLYARMFDEGKRGASALQQMERELGARSMAAGSSWEFGFELPLVVDAMAVGIGEDRGARQVQLTFAIPGTALTPTSTVMGAYYQVRFRAAVRNPAGAIVAIVDTLHSFRRNGVLLPTEYLFERFPVSVPPGEYTVAMVFDAGARGTILPTQTVRVLPAASEELVLSDLVLGTRRIPLALRTAAGDTAWVNPTRRFVRATPMELHLEVLGLSPETPYTVQLDIVRPGSTPKRDRSALKVGFGGVHPGGTARIDREIALNRLEPGSYRLDVTVRTADGTQAVRRREFTVIR